MNRLTDANRLYEGGTRAMAGSKFKYGTQLFEMNHLLETAKLQRDLLAGTYEPGPGQKFPISERGHRRYITSAKMRDKALNHTLCDEVVMPAIEKYVIYDNSSSQKGRGVSFHRRRTEIHLRKYFQEYGTNEGWALLIDFSGYYPNMLHETDKAILTDVIRRSGYFTEEELTTAGMLISMIFKSMELDVSRFSDEEIEAMYHQKVNPELNVGVPHRLLTGEKMLKKGVDIGNQLSQGSGIIHAYEIDNYCKIVACCHYYGRYTDDIRIFHPDKDFLLGVLDAVRIISDRLGLIINKKKTHVTKLSRPFRHLQVKYRLTDQGKVEKRINPKSISRERRKLKKYKKKMDEGVMPYEDIENSFKSWLGGHWKLMSMRQIGNMADLYYQLYGRRPTWKKKHSRLRWLMEQSSRASRSTATITSAAKK